MKKIGLPLMLAVLASGCATTKNTSQIQLEAGKVSEYKIPVAVAGDKATSNTFAQAYGGAMRSATGYRQAYTQEGITSGVLVGVMDNAASISYVHRNASGSLKNDYSAKFTVDATRAGDAYQVSVRCPEQVSNDYSGISSLPWSPFIEANKVTQDVTAICAQTTLTFQVTDSGEVNTNYNDSSVFANFTRKLKSYSPRNEEVRQYDLEKSKWFYLTESGRDYKIAVSVYPYRNGSKVTYRNVRTVACKPGKGCPDYDASFSQRLNAAITAIAND